ncbi:MAG: hypothetical protein HUU50_13430 [Candidatus Brocadiae bacterium]|nr:hypothetical protein [Candidatus Brocadiia bacterium]
MSGKTLFCLMSLFIFGLVNLYADVSYETRKIIIRFNKLRDELPWSVGSTNYEEGKKLISDSKKIYKYSSDLDKLNLRYVRCCTNLILACSCIRQGSWTSKNVATYYLGVALKDVGIGAAIFTKGKNQEYTAVWENVRQDYTKITTEYHTELYEGAKMIKNMIVNLKKLLDNPEKSSETEDVN